MDGIWNSFLYRPLLNLLILLYNTVGFQNLGLAVIWLTVLVRLALLPLSIIVERNKSIYSALGKRIQKIQQDFEKDPVMMRQTVRELLMKNKVSPWASIVLLGVQLLVLILLYQVFIGGINLSSDVLYPAVRQPQVINTNFFDLFNISERNLALSLIIAILIFLNIRSTQGVRRSLTTRKDAFFLYLFPTFTFLVLYFLPAVKGLFILTSIFLSVVIHFIQQPIYNAIYNKELLKLKIGKAEDISEKKKPLSYVGNPWDELRRRAK